MPDPTLAQKSTSQDDLDAKNGAFWNTLCGTTFAKSLGIEDDSPDSLRKFDEWYFRLYPYLDEHLDLPDTRGKRVLEIGLGYGSVGEKLARAGALYTGLDIAPGPVGMMHHRLHQAGLPGGGVEGSILEPPFPAGGFDVVIAIGCLHHTGDLQRAIQQCAALLSPGGRLTMMVYYAYSYRQWQQARPETLRYLQRETFGFRGVVGDSTEAQRAAADTDQDGNAAPHTDWISRRSLRASFKQAGFRYATTRLENIDQAGPHVKIPREVSLNTAWPQIWGLDLYATARK